MRVYVCCLFPYELARLEVVPLLLRLCSIAVALVLWLGQLQAHAEGPAARELLLFEEPHVTAAAKRPQAARSAASAVTVITAEEIRRFGFRTLAAALRSVPGFYTSSDRNYSYLGVRGFLRPTDYNDRILLLVNGHTYNDDVFQQALIGNEFGIDLEAIERIEVVRGPGSALYGGNALFAVINVVTHSGRDQPGGQVLAETGSLGRKRGQVSYGHVFGNGADVYASASVLDLDGHSSLFYPEYDSPDTNNGRAEDVDGERAYNLFLTAHYGDWTLQGGANRREKHIPTGAYDTIFNDPDTKTVDERAFAELQYEHTFAYDVNLNGRAYFDNYEYDGTYPYDVDGERVINKDLASSHWFGGELRARWSWQDWNILTVGGEISFHPDAVQENFDRGGSSSFSDERSFGLGGVYLQNETRLPYSFTLVMGARYDHSYAGNEAANPRVALIWEPTEKTVIKALYGNAFRAPNLYELYYETTGGGVVGLPNPDLEPETITSYELVIEQRLSRSVRLTGMLFHHEIDDLVDQTTPEPDVVQYANIGGARADGGSTVLDVDLTNAFRLRAAYDFQEVRAARSEPLSNSPKHTGRAGFQFPLLWGSEGAAELIVVGPRRTLAQRKLDPVVLGNLNLILPTPIPKLLFTAGLYNFLNRRYDDPAGSEHQQDSIPHDRFTFRVQARYAF